MRRRSAVIVAVALAAEMVSSPAAWAEIERRSGTVVAIEADAVIVEEIGAGRAGQPGNQTARLRIDLDASTPVVVVARSAADASDGWPGGFTTRPAGRESLREGAFVTVTLRRTDGRRAAEQVTLVALEP